MSLDTDLLLDRRRLKRRLNFWRVLTVVAVVAALLVASSPAAAAAACPHVARINVDGIITENRRCWSRSKALARDRSVSAVIVSIDSPGGTVAGGESLYAALHGSRRPSRWLP